MERQKISYERFEITYDELGKVVGLNPKQEIESIKVHDDSLLDKNKFHIEILTKEVVEKVTGEVLRKLPTDKEKK